MLHLLFALIGLAGLVLASDIAVDGAKTFARAAGVSPLTVGVTIAAIGTSLPEMATNVAVAVESMRGVPSPGVAVGNIVGSCLSQITLLVGITACFAPLQVSGRILRRDGVMALVALAVFGVAAGDGLVTRNEGLLLIGAYVTYLLYVWRSERRAAAKAEAEAEGDAEPRPKLTWRPIVQMLGGAVALSLAADLLVEHSVILARGVGISDAWLGLGVGVATGLPEMAVAIRGVRAAVPGLAVGNLIGSNITDPMASLGLGASVHPLEVADEVIDFDLPVWAAATLLGLALLASRKGVTRMRGVFLIAVFAGYSAARAIIVGS